MCYHLITLVNKPVCEKAACLKYLSAAGLGARKFKTAYVDTGDRSVWTDTPHDQQKKAQVSTWTVPWPLKKSAMWLIPWEECAMYKSYLCRFTQCSCPLCQLFLFLYKRKSLLQYLIFEEANDQLVNVDRVQ